MTASRYWAGAVAVVAAAAVLCTWIAFRTPHLSAKQTAQIGSVVKEYLIRNPEVLRDAMVELDRRQKQQAQAAQLKLTADTSSRLYTTPNQDIIGNPNGTATIVEFFDYNCGYCKRALGDLQNLVKNDPQLKVILKDIPILSQGSIEAAIVEAAVRRQVTGDQLWQFHQKLLLSHGAVGKAQAMDLARGMGVDTARLEKDMLDASLKKGIDEALELAKALDVNGTPSYVVGQEVVVGAVGYDDLRSKVANAHTCGKATC